MLITELESIASSLFETKTNTDVMNGVRASTASAVESLFSAQKDKDREELLRATIEELKDTREIELTLAFEPTRAVLSKIAIWLRENVDKNIVIATVVDPRVVAGVKIAYKGKYHDYSYAQKIKEIIDIYE